MLAAGIVIAAAFGAVVASFLNVCIDRLPAGQSLLFPPSHCGSCGKRLGALDLVPIFSFLVLRGRCRYCGVKLPNRLLWVEAGTAALFGYLFWHYGLSWDLALALFYGAFLIVVAVIDLERGLIYPLVVYAGTVIVVIASIFWAPSRVTGFSVTGPAWVQAGVVQSLIGAVVAYGFYRLVILLSRGRMGLGDPSLASFVGAMTGYLVPLAIFATIVVGGLVGIILVALRLKKRKDAVPYAPFLAIGGMITVLWGANIANWYLGRFG